MLKSVAATASRTRISDGVDSRVWQSLGLHCSMIVAPDDKIDAAVVNFLTQNWRPLSHIRRRRLGGDGRRRYPPTVRHGEVSDAAVSASPHIRRNVASAATPSGRDGYS
jgi:hypothetical protein